ncbi:MAG: mandelate racemase [Rhodobacterales bacterium]|nr:mandelate racemase [Rhodobacterales bacterium]
MVPVSAPHMTVSEVRLYERPTRLRLPFKFGVVTLTETPQAFARVRITRADGSDAWGQAAELMVPKWFDKDPALTNDQNVAQLRDALALTAEAYRTAGQTTAFGLFADQYEDLLAAGAARGLNPLAMSFGPALLDRAVLDALCRLDDLSFAQAVRANLPGIDTRPPVSALDGFPMDRFLAGLKPAPHIHARHTVGMVDPLTAADQAPGARLDDGLPETLEEVIAAYGHRYVKIKVRGDTAADLDRLTAIARVLDTLDDPYFVTLDGNEQFDDVDGILDLLGALEARADLKRFTNAILFVEQPIKRARALAVDVSALARKRPVIVDESDGTLEAFVTARGRGYAGVSSKSCKGFYKSLINAARCAAWNAEGGGDGNGRFFLSGEDLTCQAGVAVQQDLALVGLLGLGHVERNGHHYVKGMAGAPEAERATFLGAHPTLYRLVGDQTCLRIEGGRIALRDINTCPGYGAGAEPDWGALSPMAVNQGS